YPQLKGLKNIPAISVTVLPGVYNVEFKLNGSKNTPPKTQNIRDGEFAVEPTRPQRNGYSFSHWSLDRTNKNGKFIFNTTQITENIILYAIWVFNDAKVVVSASKTEAVYGEVITLTANVEHGASNIEYTWYKTNNNNPLGKDKTLTISNVAESGKYYCRVIVTDETESGKNTATAKSNELDVRILQAIDPTYVLPKITPVFYFPGITLNHITLDLGYKWSNGSTALYATTDAGNKYNFVFTPLDTSNYKTITDKAIVIVKKANYDNITHIPLTTTYKECLKLSDLSNSLNGCFRWENTEQLVFAGKEQRFDALYNADENNYNDFKLTIIVTVDRAQSIVHPYYKGKLYANVDMDLVVFALKDGDTSGICSLRAGQVAVVGVESTYDWAFTPTDKDNYYNAIGKVKLFVYAVNLESIIISSQPTKMSYLAFEQFNTEGMIVSKVFNNGVIEQTFDYRIEYVNNPIGVNWFLCDSPSINTVYRDIKIVLSTNIEFIVILSNIQVTKASYVPEEVAHTPINIQYFDLIMLNDLQKKLKENYLFYAVNSIHAGDGQSYKAKYNRDKANYFDIDVMVTVNISKATYSNKIHNTLTTTYEIGLTLSKLQLKENYFWNVPKQLLNAGENQQFQAYYNADEINYENFPLSIMVNVKKAQYILTNITFANKEFCYDRQPHDIKIDGVLPDGISVSYVGNGAVRAGLYTVIANFVMDKPENYESVKSMQANMLITKKNITVDFTTDFDGEFIANNEIDINTITNGVLDDDSVTIKIQILKDGKIVATGDNSMSMIFEAGYYTICTSLYNSENYNLISVTERYFVVKAASIDSENIEGQPPQVILSVNNGIDPNATLVVQTIDISKTEHDINQSLAKKL
ncbi:MAG: immunoglobulin domain-containing protein, partial [Clostridia bacterium]